MSNTFFEKSKEIANDFLQSIVFLDDRAFADNSDVESNPETKHNAFNIIKISKAFAKQQKVCAVYNPTTVSDIDDFKEISKKADVVILDWYIDVQNTDTVTEEDLTADAEEEDTRGEYTKQIISDLIASSAENSLKLIIVYTGEDTLEDIVITIHKKIAKQNDGFQVTHDECMISSANIRILVRGKSEGKPKGESEDTRFTSRTHLLDKLVTYDELPSFVLTEFTKMTTGLLSNFALLSLTTIRNNSHKILHLFSKELDAPYLGHKAILPVQNDSEELLLKLFGDTVSDLLHYTSISKKVQDDLIDTWVDNNINDENITLAGKSINRTKESTLALLHSDIMDVKKRFEEVLKESKIKEIQNSKTTELFLNLDGQNPDHINTINSDFAKLTHHKSLFIPKNIDPKLSLGTVIRSSTQREEYYVCIQQRCDSVRIKENRKFLFLPLTVATENKFIFITPEGVKLKLNKTSYSIKTIKFKCNNNESEIKGKKNVAGKYIFSQIYEGDEQYEWVFDLKDLHSQRIVANYAASLSRVGLDESEWLRISGS